MSDVTAGVPADSTAPPPAPAPREVRPRRWPDDVRTAALVVLVAMGVGVVAGLVWWKVAPRALVEVGADHGASFVDGGSKAFIGADGWFALIAIGCGLLVGSLSAWRWRRHGIGVVVGVALGGVLGALVARVVGQTLGHVDLEAATAGLSAGATLEAGLKVRAPGVLALWPLASLLVVLAVGASYGLGDDPVDDVLEPLGEMPAPASPPAPESGTATGPAG